MVARPSTVAGFAPVDRPRVAVASDGTLAAIHEPSRVNVVELPSCTAFAELGTDSAAACEIAWVGTPPRLLVLSRYETHSIVHLVDPFGPRTIAEIRLEQPMRLYAAVGTYALAIGSQGAAVLAAGDKTLTPFTFPARTVPVAAGAAGAMFMVAIPGAIEEWDPASRMPKRRLKLSRPATITAVGGSERVVWMTTTQEPSRIDVIPLVNRGQPKAHDLPEPIAQVSSHPRSDLIACIGATSGRVWVIDLDGRTGLRMVGPTGIDRCEAVGIVLGRVAGVLAAQAQHATTVVTLERPDAADGDGEARAKTPSTPPHPKSATSTLYGDVDEDKREARDKHEEDTPTAVTLAVPLGEPVVPTPVTAAPPKPVARAPLPEFANKPSTSDKHAKDFAAWRERLESPRARTEEPAAPLFPDAGPLWRLQIVSWTTALDRDTFPAETPIAKLVERLDLAPELEPVLGLLYANHLQGTDGAAPVHIATLLGHWDEALGRGSLATRGFAVFERSRVRMSDALLRVLDEHPPRTGTLVGTPGFVSLLGPCVIVSASPLPIVAEACLTSIGGAILAADVDADPAALVEEARPYGAAPMWRVKPELLARVPAEQPIILVADDDVTADRLGVPRLT